MSKTAQTDLSDWLWLTGKEGRALAGRLKERWDGPNSIDPLRAAKWLRAEGLSPHRTHLLIEQLQLRNKAAAKFARSDDMFLEAQLLQQSTGESLSRWKAERFEGAASIVDICCGLGGDLIALKAVNHNATVLGIDRNEIACHLANLNGQANGVDVSVQCMDADEFEFDNEFAAAWFHMDPDRRPEGKRTTTIDQFSPSIDSMDRIIQSQKNGAIKLAPASQVPNHWRNQCEQQWIGDARECKQLMAWFGETTNRLGQRSAAAIDEDGRRIFEWVEQNPTDCRYANAWGPYLFEPHPTLIAGSMVESLAAGYTLEKATNDIAYLTGELVDFAGMTAFEILESTKMDEATVVDALIRHDAASFETKKRGLDHHRVDRFSKAVASRFKKRMSKQIDGQNGQPLVLILTRINTEFSAVIAKRVNRESNS